MNIILSQHNYTFYSRIVLALKDIGNGIKNWRIWLLLAWQDIQLRYRRSVLGPFWITLSMTITISVAGLLYGTLFKMHMARYFPYFAAGMLAWNFISVSIIEGSNIFFEAEKFLKQVHLPFSTFIFKTVTRNVIIFLHNIVIFIPIILIFHIKINLNSLIAFYGLLLMIVNAIALDTILAIWSIRFRDITQMINSLIQIIFFLTPIIWSPEILPEQYQFVLYINPFAQFLEMIRNPLMGLSPSYYAFIFTIICSIANVLCALMLFARFRARITYWL